MSAFVLDCSALINSALINTALPGQSAANLDELQLHAPSLIDYEFVSAVRRLVQKQVISDDDATLSVGLLQSMDLARHPAHRLVPRMWSMRHTISSYDASYVALAEALDVPLLTSDTHLALAAEQYCEVFAV